MHLEGFLDLTQSTIRYTKPDRIKKNENVESNNRIKSKLERKSHTPTETFITHIALYYYLYTRESASELLGG